MSLSNANILVDTSIWVDFFRGNEKVAFVTDLLLDGLVCTNEVILTELLPSMRVRREENLIKLMGHIRKINIEINWLQLRNIQYANLQNGNNKVPLADAVIAHNCIQNDLEILTADRHFVKMSEYLPLQIYEYM
jgi:predicted nucleic acid-binding protein